MCSLTFTIGTASLEAKQKFRAPRTSPILLNSEVGVSSAWADSRKGADSYKFGSLSMSSPNPLVSKDGFAVNTENNIVVSFWNSDSIFLNSSFFSLGG